MGSWKPLKGVAEACRLTLLPALVVLLCVAAFAQTAQESKEPAQPPEEKNEFAIAKEVLADRNYDKAVELLKKVLAEKPENPDVVRYFIGVAQYYKGDYEGAIETFRALQKDLPQSPWRAKAAFREADALYAQKNVKGAVEIYEREIVRLVSDERKLEIANIYLKFADKFFEPPKGGPEEKQPEYAKALEFYNKALEIGLKGIKKTEVRIKVARCYIELNNFRQAIVTLKEELKELKDRKEATIAHLADQVMFYLGIAYFKAHDFTEARKTFRDMLADFAESKSAPDAAYHVGLTYGIPTPTNIELLELGAKAHRDFVQKYPDHKLASQAEHEIGLSYMHLGRMEDAAKAFEEFIKKYPTEEKAKELPTAKHYLGRCLFAQKKYDEAIKVWQQFLVDHPADKDWNTVQQRIIEAEYSYGQDFFTDKKWDMAKEAWTKFMAKYPLDRRVPDIMYTFGQIEYDRQRWDAAIEEWTRLVSKFPNTEQSSRGQFMIGQTQELKLFKFEAAVESYKKLTWGSYAPQAQQRIAEMSAKKLVVVTERVFLSNETPSLKITTRNIEKLTLKAYKINLEEYFRKMHVITGVENLDIALIEPTQTWEVMVEGYEKYKECENNVPMPFKGEGVYAINVSEESFEATTLLIVSDIALVIKSSKKDIFVFAKNMLTRKPCKDVKILVSDGKKIVLEGTTNLDGVLHIENPEVMKTVESVSVFGLLGGSFASNVASLQGISVVMGMEPRGFIYTDRPAYRPGDSVKVRGIVRKVEKGVYTFKKDDEFDLAVIAPTGAALFSKKVKLSEHGTVEAEFKLDGATPLGAYRLTVSQKDGPTFTGGFRVEEYRLEKYRITVALDKEVVFRGEQVTGVIRVEYYYGEPAPGKMVRYWLPPHPEVAATTDANGEVKFDLSTRDMAETGVMTLNVALPDENVFTTANIWLAATSFVASVSTVRDVYLTGEEFDIFVTTTDAAGKPLSVPLDLSVLLIEGEGDQRREVLVKTAKVTTSKEDGRGKTIVSVGTGGRHTIRVRGIDRFGNAVVASRDIMVSGEDDEIKLRLLSDTEEFRAKEKANLRLVSRLENNLGLMTFEGEGVYGYKLVDVTKGVSRVELEMDERFAPNFAVAVCVMDGNKFHEARKELIVTKGLNITITTKEKEYKPGDEIEVMVETRDQLGKLVPAEVSLAVVDEALFGIFPEGLPKITDVFYGQKRPIAVVTTTSCTFKYEAPTKPVITDILEELERLKEEERLRTEYERAVEKAREVVSRKRAEKMKVADWKDAADMEELDDPEEIAFEVGEPAEEMVAEMDAMGEDIRFARVRGGRAVRGGGVIHARFQNQAQLAAQEELRKRFVHTAFWAPAVLTGRDGKASVRVKLPDSITTWRITSYGTTVDTLVGKGTASIVTRKKLFVDAKLPSVFVEGDTPRMRAIAFNHTGEKQEVKISCTVTIGKEKFTDSKTVTLENNASGELDFEVKLANLKDISVDEALPRCVVRIAASAGGHKDAIERSIPFEPWGYEVRRGSSGLVKDSETVTLELPQTGQEVYRWKRMAVVLGPSVERVVLDMALESPIPFPAEPGVRGKWTFPGSPPYKWEQFAAARGLAAIEAMTYLEATGRSAAGMGALDYAKLTAQLEEAINTLIVTQNNDGGWSWSAVQGRPSDAYVSAESVRMLARAKRKGFDRVEDTLKKGTAFLRQLVAGAGHLPADTRLIVYWALATAGQGDFAVINAMYRERHRLSTYGIAVLVLTLLEIHKPDMAREVAAILETRDLFAREEQVLDSRGERIYWIDDRVERIALAALALQKTIPESARIKECVDWLLAHWYESVRWSGKGLAATVAALGTYFGRTQLVFDRYTVKINVNDKFSKEITMTGTAGTQWVQVPAENIVEGPNRITLTLKGKGQCVYNVFLSAFSSVDVEGATKFVHLERSYHPAPKQLDGKDVPRGFSIVTPPIDPDYPPWTNKMTQLAEGNYGTVHLKVWPNQEGYLVVEEFLPGGTTALEASIAGNFDHYEMRDGKLVFYLGQRQGMYRIKYDIYGYLPGEYRIRPSRVHAMYQPERLTTMGEHALTVLARGAQSTDEYKMTPDELYHLGKAYFEKKEPSHMKSAAEYLEKLLEMEFTLREDVYRDCARMLLFASIEEEDAKDIVKYFEIVKERYASLVIPFDAIIKVAQAYRTIGEFERALQVFRATAEASFSREMTVGSDLDRQGEFLGSVEYFKSLLLNYPDIPAVESAYVGLSQFVYGKAEKAREIRELREKKLGSRDVLKMAGEVLDDFLALYPESPTVDGAAFSLANIYMDLGQLDEVIRFSRKLQERHPKSTFLDAYIYLDGLACFKAEQYAAALKLLERVATEKFPTPSGELGESANKWLAIYIMGQIYHSMGQPVKAIAEYEKVAERFPDAKEAIEYFRQKSLSVPEVTTFRANEEASVKLTYRNVPAVDILVYRVDLMKLYLIRKTLRDMANINLAGIAPYHAMKVELGEGKDYKDMEKTVKLPLKETGAYLVVVKGAELDASGMVVMTDLRLDVQEEVESGRVRVNVKNVQTEKAVGRVHVKAIGEANDRFKSGYTDLRGVFVADDIRGRSTVIVRTAKNEYAFYRGMNVLQPALVAALQPPAVPPAHRRTVEEARVRREARRPAQELDALLMERQAQFMQQQLLDFEGILKKDQGGVDVEKVR